MAGGAVFAQALDCDLLRVGGELRSPVFQEGPPNFGIEPIGERERSRALFLIFVFILLFSSLLW